MSEGLVKPEFEKVVVSVEFIGEKLGRGNIEATATTRVRDLREQLKKKTGLDLVLYVKQTYMPPPTMRVQDLAFSYGVLTNGVYTLQVKASQNAIWG